MSANLHERLVDALVADRDGDGFELAAATPQLLQADRAGHSPWRVSVTARLAGRRFGGIRLDVSPRVHELVVTEIVDVNRHAAEKFHAMLRDFGARDTRVRDLVDLVLLVEHHLLAPDRLAEAIRRVWAERDGADPPATWLPLPESWPARYERLAADHGAVTPTFADADRLTRDTWDRMFTPADDHEG